MYGEEWGEESEQEQDGEESEQEGGWDREGWVLTGACKGWESRAGRGGEVAKDVRYVCSAKRRMHWVRDGRRGCVCTRAGTKCRTE